MRNLIIPALCGLSLMACEQAVEPTELEAETPPVSAAQTETADAEQQPAQVGTVAEVKRAQIDWAQASADYVARDIPDTGMVEIASGSSPVVPILLPEQNVGVASTGEDALQFRPLADGYFAVKPGDEYDMIINGTDRLIARPGDSATATDTDLKFEETMTGAQVSFSRYGASYLVEFMCKDPATAVKGSCVSEADALAEVEKLLIAGTR